FYLGTGVVAGITHVLLHPDSSLPVVGASGAVSGVLGAYMVLYPRVRIHTLVVLIFYFTVVRVPAFFYLGIWFALQFLSSMATTDSSTGGAAFAAHIGGFVAGVVATYFVLITRSRRPSHYRSRER